VLTPGKLFYANTLYFDLFEKHVDRCVVFVYFRCKPQLLKQVFLAVQRLYLDDIFPTVLSSNCFDSKNVQSAEKLTTFVRPQFISANISNVYRHLVSQKRCSSVSK